MALSERRRGMGRGQRQGYNGRTPTGGTPPDERWPTRLPLYVCTLARGDETCSVTCPALPWVARAT